MASPEKYLVIKTSGIKGAGQGLFTKKFIEKGTRIVEYKGRKTTWKEVKQQTEFNGYVYYVNRNFVIDAKDHLKTFGRFANDAKGLNKKKDIKNNSRYVVYDEKVFIEATKDIPEGGEIFVSYGKGYWDVIRHNKSLGL